jgi:hypothetical protein
VEDFQISSDTASVVQVAAFHYELEQPGTDLIEVLSKEKKFEKALQAV